MEKKSVNLSLIATEGFSTVLDSAMYPWQHLKSPKKIPLREVTKKRDLLWSSETRFMSAWERGWPKLFLERACKDL